MRKMILVAMMVVVAGFVACGTETVDVSTQTGTEESANVTTESGRIYECDYKTMDKFFSYKTKVSTVLDGKEITISGNAFALVTDPLTVTDPEGNVLGYAGDAYGYIEQDDHGIYVGDSFDINMCGEFAWPGNSYTLKNAEGEVVANAKFNAVNTKGSITDANGNVIAKYYSGIGRNDYTVTIQDNEICSDLSILMIMASYVSDYQADNN